MLVYDYIELKEELFEHIIGNKTHYKKVEHDTIDIYYYKAFKTTIKKVIAKDGNINQFFINSAHPV